MYIGIDGPDFVGKDTQLETIKQMVLRMGIKEENILMTSEPGGSANGKEIRQLLLHNENVKNLSPEAELSLYIADRMELQEATIDPFIDLMYEKGLTEKEWCIISNRTHVSSYGYQRYHNSTTRRIYDAIHTEDNMHLPDIYVVLTAPVLELVHRSKSTKLDRLENVPIGVLNDRLRAFKHFIDTTSDKAVIEIDTSGSVEDSTLILRERLHRAIYEFCGGI